MHLNFDTPPTRPPNHFSRLGMWYIIALGIIAVVAIAGQVLIQWHLSTQLSDSQVVNVAGKQRMLSQEISKTALLLQSDVNNREGRLDELKTSLALWERSHLALQQGDDSLGIPYPEGAINLLPEVDAHYEAIRNAAHEIVRLVDSDTNVSPDSLRDAVRTILQHEGKFLAGMEKVVYWYAEDAERKVSTLSKIEYTLLGVTLLVIILEVLFIFRPTAMNVNRTLEQLMASERNARKLSKEIGALYASLEKSYEQVAMVNEPLENPRLYAKSDRGGNITFISDHFRAIAGDISTTPGMRISDLFPGMADADDWMDDVIDTVSDGQFFQKELAFDGPRGQRRWVSITITPVYYEDEIDELLILGSDITRRREAEQNMKLKNRAEIEKKINQQKFRSVLILEGQEEERNRIAMDIHDGIGQMLTSLKYQIESIDLSDVQRAAQRISELELLIKQVIREVRRVTFNLKPTVLGDYGLQAALKVFIQETAKVVDVQLVYHTAGEIDRLPQKIENNIFRIIQEAINNAIKYSGANRIDVTLAQENDELVITVKDEGMGFDTRIVEARNVNIDSGRGFFNMYERTDYVNGELSIESEPSKGTTVRLVVPMRNTATTQV